ncbi:uncharacterized protein LOC114744056 [Neltuma alba]|uniref:uncharacterized protein LOC114732559 n=1 Tax=Neltuma alba TaxID=207710 RepID=UPI0010A4004C|nr:uncharacterized protein LOC114732559 [Prosopis alba]XP_028788077.1 uncharacterized protein LOC114744056 [Prosopis alba]
MGTALARTPQSLRNSHFVRFSFSLFRNLTSASSSASSASQNPTSSKKSKKRKKNFFEVAQFLPSWGIGYHMAKTHWTDVSYEITKINLYKDGRHGKAWGVVHKNGLPAADSPKKISGVHKRCWRYIKNVVKSSESCPNSTGSADNGQKVETLAS